MNPYYAALAELEGHDPFGSPTRQRKPEINRAPRPSASVEAEVMENALLLRSQGLNSTQIAAVMRLNHGVKLQPGTWQKVMREVGAPRVKVSSGQFGHRP